MRRTGDKKYASERAPTPSKMIPTAVAIFTGSPHCVDSRLWPQRRALARRVLTLACQFRQALRIGAGFAAVLFPGDRDTATSGMTTFCRCIHRKLPLHCKYVLEPRLTLRCFAHQDHGFFDFHDVLRKTSYLT